MKWSGTIEKRKLDVMQFPKTIKEIQWSWGAIQDVEQ